MDNFDIKIENTLNINLQEPLKYEMTIKKALSKENVKKYKHKKIVHTCISTIIGMFLTVGVVFASSTVYQKIWVEPKKYETYDEYMNDYINSVKQPEVTSEDKEEAVNEEQAKEKAIQILDKMGYKNEKVAKVELTKNSVLEDELLYNIKTKINANSGFEIIINAKNGKILSCMNLDLGKEPIETDKLTEEEVRNYSASIYSIFRLKEGEYKIKNINEVPFCYNSRPTKFWKVMYCKVYDGAFNYFERFEISFLVKDGVMQIQGASIANQDVNFENNPIVISKEDAIKIAEETDRKITDNKIVYTATAIQIRKMNSFIYEQEKNGEKSEFFNKGINKEGEEVKYPKYAIFDNTARKVWAIKFDYEIGEPDPDNEYKYWSKLYFVDTTTGEIIGGSLGRRGDDMT